MAGAQSNPDAGRNPKADSPLATTRAVARRRMIRDGDADHRFSARRPWGAHRRHLRQQGPAKLAGVLMGSDRAANSCQLGALNRLAKAAPEVPTCRGTIRE